MPKSKIIVRRYPYEEPHLLNLEFFIWSGKFIRSKAEIYCTPDDLEKIGNTLRGFPVKIPDEYIYTYGYENSHTYFKMKIYTLHSSGHCAIQFDINFHVEEPDQTISHFSIYPIEPMALSKLGDLFVAFAKLNHLEFCWSPNGDGELFVEYQI
jgi:hypothetical protein